MTLIEEAPPLIADGLGKGYKLLAEFNGTVLAGHMTEYGAEFITWDWTQNRTSLWQGHYFGIGGGCGGYRAAKQDFAVQSGLLPQSALFTAEQLTEMYRSIPETLDGEYPLTDERRKLLESAAGQIEDFVLDLDGLTNLLFPFDGVELDAGRLAVWRLQTHDQFGGTWLPDEAFNLLDFARIGKNHREAEGSAFTSWGYVERHSEWKEVYKTLDLSAPVPDYMILLRVSHNDNSPLLKLPANAETIGSVPRMLDEPDWLDLSLECLDCCAPALMDAVARTDDIASLNCLAEKLAALEPQELTAYKALLETTNCQDLDSAGFLIDQLDKYNFCPEFSSPSDVAMGQLHLILGEQEARLLLPHLNLDGYGKELLRHYGSALTPYGLLEKKDNTPVMSEEDQPKTGEMEMMQ